MVPIKKVYGENSQFKCCITGAYPLCTLSMRREPCADDRIFLRVVSASTISNLVFSSRTPKLEPDSTAHTHILIEPYP